MDQNKAFEHGQEFLFLGKRLQLEIAEHSPRNFKSTELSFDGNRWKAAIPLALSHEEREKQLKERFLIWYRMQAKEILGSRVFHYGQLMDVWPKEITIKTHKSLWGSCNFRKQKIRLNWQIVMSPLEVIDYVIVHELCHLTVPNHSRSFWNSVEKILPNYKNQRSWLRMNQKEMMLPFQSLKVPNLRLQKD